jgi:asparagine synthase (glutamine-hydrolysing)
VATTWAAWRCLFDDDEIRLLTGAPPDPSPRWLTDVSDSARAQLRHLDFAVYLRATLLRDTDVFSMANSVEVRVPLLDRSFVRSTEQAELTKQGLAQLMDDDLLSTRARARKLAFTLPWQRWLPLLEPSLDDLLAAGGRLADVVDVVHARRLLADGARTDPMSGQRRWALLVLARWLNREPAARRPAPRPV